MSLIDFMFPEQAQASHLREIAQASRELQRQSASREAEENGNHYRIAGLDRRIKRLEGDVALLAALNALLIRKYVVDTGKTIDDLRREMQEVDASDGVVDGGFDTDELRALLGIRAERPAPAIRSDERCPDCSRILSKHLGRCLYCGYVAPAKT